MEESTFNRVKGIILELVDDIDESEIANDSHMIDTLGIDSLNLLDILFTVDKKFDIKIPLEEWTTQSNDGEVDTNYYWRLDNFCQRVDELVVEKTRKDQEL